VLGRPDSQGRAGPGVDIRSTKGNTGMPQQLKEQQIAQDPSTVEEQVCSRIAHVMRGAVADLGPEHPWWAPLSGLAAQFELDAREAAAESLRHGAAEPPLRLVP
jgi:hypothetical protein